MLHAFTRTWGQGAARLLLGLTDAGGAGGQY